jgi:DAK2 domain fusion protein YloV
MAETQIISGELFKVMLANGYRNLIKNEDTVNNLNVFPVPDGDTGTNMTMTLGGGVSSVETEDLDIADLMKKFAKGTLLSARGNSGVIFSQFIRGIAKGAEGLDSLSVADFANALRKGSEQAYKAVVDPAEGTMLTVMRETADYLCDNADSFGSFESCFDSLIPEMKKSLNKTPDLLPVLKEAGVVDSGGAGLLVIFEGMNMALNGEIIEDLSKVDSSKALSIGELAEDEKMEYGYCTEFILQLMNAKTDVRTFDVDVIVSALENIGDSVVAVKDGNLVKVHVHSFSPEKVIEIGRNYGEFLSIKIENMAVQHNEIKDKKDFAGSKPKKYGIVAVASGKGIIKYFREIGVDVIIDGGQTNNPSANDFLEAFNILNAEHIIVLPNNSNILLTAKQAASMYKDTDIRVLTTKSIAEGYSALSMMNLSCDSVEELIDDMTSGLKYVTTGLVTTATRDAKLNGVEITKGHYIGLDDDNILSCEANKLDATMNLFKNLPDMDDKQVVTIFYGNDVTEDELKKLESRFTDEYPLTEIGFIEGGQEVYSFIMAIE